MKKVFQILILFSVLLLKTENYSSKGNLQVAFGAEENQLILKSIDSSVSNFGDEEEKKLYKRCIQHYIEFQSLHTAGDYGKAYESVRNTQRLLVILYDRILTKNILSTRLEINRLARIAKGKERTETNAFLRLALRDLSEAEQKLIIAKNTRPYLYLLKLRDMLFGLKILKHSARFVILLALLHNTDFPIEIETTNFDSLYEDIDRAISKDKEKYLTIHWDNHFKTYIGDGIYTMTMYEPNMEELTKPFEDIDPAYFRKNILKKR
ncbi:adhesin OmpL37 family surface protein [Leptospira sp. 'Mane']|uniref:adhesin OmpL37 family surface protein n=1 Tax=Leptospira sp. 'Mane' TaxID=3387407 RepID=UPI00398B2704